MTVTLIGQIRKDHLEIEQKREILQNREIFWQKTLNTVQANACGLDNGFMYMLWFNFILGLNVLSFCFKLIIINYHTIKKEKKI